MIASVSSPFILAFVCIVITASASIQHPNLRGQNILDLIDLDLDDLPCYMRDDPRPNVQCAQQNSPCAQDKHCFVISVSSGTHYVCSSNEPCSDTDRSATNTTNTTTTTSTTTTTPACIGEGYNGCHPSPFVQPNCCPGSHCIADPDQSTVVHGHYTNYICVDLNELGGGELDE